MARFLSEILKISCLALKHIIQIEKKLLSTVYNQYQFIMSTILGIYYLLGVLKLIIDIIKKFLIFII